jgi:hypothetical protein
MRQRALKAIESAQKGPSPLHQQKEEAIRTTVNARRETVTLVAATKWKRRCFAADDRNVVPVQRVMIDKISGKLIYSVVGFGGCLGVSGSASI